MVKTTRFSRTLRIYVDGIDIHPANAHHLMMAAKKLFSNVHLIVGVPHSDGRLHEMLCQSRYVDQVIRSAPSIVDDAFLDDHKIDFVARTQCDFYGVLVAISRSRRFRTNLYFQYIEHDFFYLTLFLLIMVELEFTSSIFYTCFYLNKSLRFSVENSH